MEPAVLLVLRYIRIEEMREIMKYNQNTCSDWVYIIPHITLQKRIRPKCSITSGGRGTLLVVVTCFTLDSPDTKPLALG